MPARRTRSRVDPVKVAAEFNSRSPVGTDVRYRSRPGAEPLRTKTRSEAWVLGDHTAVVLVEGVAGGVAISAIEVVETGEVAG